MLLPHGVRKACRRLREGSQWNGTQHCEFTHGEVTWAVAGKVTTEEESPAWIGATAHTNNTGELTAMHYALQRAAARAPGKGKEVIWSDSLYTINMTTGMWLPKRKRNNDVIARLRHTWRWVQRARPGEVSIRHVRSHTKVPGNELADQLAETGRVGGNPTAREASAWLTRWRAKQSGSG